MRYLPLSIILLWLACSPALADQVRLANGDVLHGEIIKKENDKLVFKTSYAGEINIQWSQITRLSSDKPQNIVLSTGEKIQATLTETKNDAYVLAISAKEPARKINLNETKFINPSPDLLSDGYKWSGNIATGGSITQGNTETRIIRFDGETIARSIDNRYTLGAVVNRTYDKDSSTQFNSRAYGKYDHFFSPHWYGYANIALENDRFRDLRLFSSTGLGSGYQIFETPNLNLSVEGGLNYTVKDYYDVAEESYPGLRWALKYDQLILGSTTRLFHEHELLAGLNSDSPTLLRSKTGLRFPLIFNFNASTQFDYNWDSKPPSGTLKNYDATLLFTLGYGW